MPLVFEDNGLGFGGIGIEMDKILSEIDPEAGAAGAEQPGDDFEELSGGIKADVQRLTITCGIGSVSTVLYPTHGLVVLWAATAGGDEERKATIVAGGLVDSIGDLGGWRRERPHPHLQVISARVRFLERWSMFLGGREVEGLRGKRQDVASTGEDAVSLPVRTGIPVL